MDLGIEELRNLGIEGCRMQDAGCRMQDAGCEMLGWIDKKMNDEKGCFLTFHEFMKL